MSITYDGTDILNNIQKTRIVKHESVASFNINSLKPSRSDGTIFISEVVDTKEIILEGIIEGTSQANLETNIDTFNELMNRRNKNLDISYAGGTRRYVCIPQEITYNRDYYNLLFVPFRVVMQVPSGFGTDTSTTSITAKTLTAAVTTDTISFSGSAEPKPIIRLTINTVGNGDVLKIENTDNDDYIQIELYPVSASDYVDIDCENLTVLKNGTTGLTYNGKFPKFEIGSNNIKYTITGSGSTLDQKQELTSSFSPIWKDTYTPQSFQSFIPSVSGSIGKIGLHWGISAPSAGTEPTGKITYIVYEDDNGSLGDVVQSSLQYDLSDFSVSGSWKEIDLQQKTFVTKGKKYWITAELYDLVSSDATHYVYFSYSTDNESYLNGKCMARKVFSDPLVDGIADSAEVDMIDEGEYDLAFRVYMGDGDAPDYNISSGISYTKKYL